MKSKKLQTRRIAGEQSMAALFYLKDGSNPLGRWAVCVPADQRHNIINDLLQGNTPEVVTEVRCVGNNDGKEKFFSIGGHRWATHVAPAVIEEPTTAFDLLESVATHAIDGTTKEALHPICGIVFVDTNGDVVVGEDAGKKKPLRFNFTNFEASGGKVSEDGRTWQVTIGGTEYVGHLTWVLESNRQRVIGAVAYVTVGSTQPASVLIGECLGMAPKLLAQNVRLQTEVAALRATLERVQNALKPQ